MYLAWGQTTSTFDMSAWSAIASASIVVQVTLLVLVTMSVFCWAITFSKWRQFKVMKIKNKPFNDAFYKVDSLDELFGSLSHFKDSSLANVFYNGYLEMQTLASSPLAQASPDTQEEKVSTSFFSGIDNLKRALEKAIGHEISHMERHLSLLATTGSTSPFIGLFGTVWGIMGAFQKIGTTQSAHLAVVAPGISEALLATAIGLVVAIPATIAYNHYLTQIRQQELVLNNFATDFLNIARRNFFKGR